MHTNLLLWTQLGNVLIMYPNSFDPEIVVDMWKLHHDEERAINYCYFVLLYREPV